MKLRALLLIIVAMAVGFTAEAQTTSEKIKSFANEHMTLSGYLQAGFEWNEANDPTTTFYIKRARLSLTGNFLEEKMDFRLQVDMAGSPKICDLYFRYKPMNELNVQFGQYKLPFALENELCGPTTFEFIEYSYITTYFARNHKCYDGIGGATGRDLGAQLYGGFIEREGYNIINYNVGIYNGAGINTKDNNSSKDFVGRVIVKPIKDLSISASYMYSEVNHNAHRYMKTPRWSVGAWYNSRHWVARSEFAHANFGGNLTNAFYVLGGYHFEQPWSVVARYEFVKDANSILDEDRITLGAAYKPYSFLRLQLNASYTLNHALKRNTPGVNLLVSAIF
ncbi:MAG: porin [Alistipes sp.]|nr:porin [Alistipes sp.]